jgi:putative ABC transport system permease protein
MFRGEGGKGATRDPAAAAPAGAPRMALLLLTLLLREPAREVIVGDLNEAYVRWAMRAGLRQARRWYWRQAMLSLVARVFRRRAGRGVQPGPRKQRDSRISSLMTEARQSWRALRRRPGFTAVAVFTLALGIGATTAVYAMLNQVLFRPLPGVRDPGGASYIEFPPVGGEFNGASLSLPNFDDLRSSVTLFEGIAGFGTTSVIASAEGRAPAEVMMELIQGDFFSLLGVRPVLGRLFADQDRDPALVVISERLWQSHFAGAPDVIGRGIRLNGHMFTVLGVTGGGFAGVRRNLTIDAWMPAATFFSMASMSERAADRSSWFFNSLVARVRPGVTEAAAESQLSEIYARLVRAYPQENEGLAGHEPRIYPGLSVIPLMREWTRNVVRLLFGAVSIVLLIACANGANLLLLRSTQRRSEVAMRRALGATSSRVFTQQMMESLLVSLFASGAAVLVALGLAQLLRGLRLVRLAAFEGMSLDVRILGFAILVGIGSAVIAGTVPALLAGRIGSASALKEAGTRDTGRRATIRSVATVLQLALSLALLISSVLLVRTVRNLYAVDLGFEPRNLLTFSVSFDRQSSPEQIDGLKRRLFERLRSVPGVQGVAFDLYGPLWGSTFISGVVRAGQPAEDATRVLHRFVTPGYFETLRIAMLRGRGMREEDWSSAGRQNIVITAALARQMFGDEDPVGQELVSPSRRAPETYSVIGVTADVRLSSPQNEPDVAIFQPTHAGLPLFMTAMVRTPDPGPQLVAALREAASSVAPDLPFPDAVPLMSKLDDRISEQRLFARLLTILSTLAVLLAAVGLYGVIAWTVADRTREIGVRVALGAEASRIVRLVMGQTGRLVGIGIGLGVLGAVWISNLIESKLFGITALDPLTYASAALFFVLVAIAACLAPTRTATRVDPMRALRHD